MPAIDIVILSNGPGEVATWVRPVVQAIRQKLDSKNCQCRISVLLSPCPHSTGKEAAIALSYPEVNRVLPPEDFWRFLLWGKTKDHWQWHQQGIVIFLGGDQFYTVAIAKRLGYSSLIYAEWEARWYRFVDHFAAMNQKVIDKVPFAYRHKFTLVGDLMVDTGLEGFTGKVSDLPESPTVGLLVGSKPAKLAQGVPLCLAIAEKLQEQLPLIQFIIPLAPTLDLPTLIQYANSQYNPLVEVFGNVTGQLILPDSEDSPAYILTSGKTKIKLITHFPATEELLKCQICLTTVGANTAQLGSLGIPMIVLLPTQQLDAMRSWDGLPGILANLPGVGTILAKLINWLVIKQGRLFAWPNIWAGEAIVPELVGLLQPENIANLVRDYLTKPSKLQAMSAKLIALRGQTDAARQIADIIESEINKNLIN